MQSKTPRIELRIKTNNQIQKMDSLFSFLSAHPIWFFVFATLGGTIVSIGLWLELVGDKDWCSSLMDFVRSKKKRKLGEKLVLYGVVIETVVGGVLIGKELWEAKKTHNEIEAKSPLNQPIGSISAFAFVLQEGTNVTGAEPFKPNWSFGNFFNLRFRSSENPTNAIMLTCRFIDQAKFAPGIGWIIEYREPEIPISGFSNPKTIGDALKYDLVVLSMPALPHGTKILGGRVKIYISGFSKEFEIPPQNVGPIFDSAYNEILTLPVTVDALR